MRAATVTKALAERASWSVAAVFGVVGLVLSAWFTQIPQFKAALSLSDAQLGLALLCPAAGALVSMQVAGRIAGQYGSAALVRAAPLAAAAATALVGASHGFPALMAALLVFGVAADHGSASVTGAVAKFTTLSCGGSLLGPAAIGWLAQGAGLTWSLASVLLVLAAIGGFADWTSRALPGSTAAVTAAVGG